MGTEVCTDGSVQIMWWCYYICVSCVMMLLHMCVLCSNVVLHNRQHGFPETTSLRYIFFYFDYCQTCGVREECVIPGDTSCNSYLSVVTNKHYYHSVYYNRSLKSRDRGKISKVILPQTKPWQYHILDLIWKRQTFHTSQHLCRTRSTITFPEGVLNI